MMTRLRFLLGLDWSPRQRPLVRRLVRSFNMRVPTDDLIKLFYARSAANPDHQWSNIEKIKSNMNVRFRKHGVVMCNEPSADRKNGFTRLVLYDERKT